MLSSPNPKYYVNKHSFELDNKQEITEEKWNQINKYKDVASNLLSIEQKYDLLLSNYYEFEKSLLECALKYSFHLSDFVHRPKTSLNIARVTINLLMSIGLYEEQLRKRHLKKVALDSYQESFFKEEIDRYCTSDDDFEFIKELRNYVAHNDLPLDSLTFSKNSDKFHSEELDKRGIYVIPTIKEDKLLRDNHFKNSKIKNITTTEGEIDLRKHIRLVISSLSQIHKNLRNNSENNLETTKVYLKKVLDTYNEFCNSKSDYCYVMSNDKKDSDIYISLTQFERINEFKKNNLSHFNLINQYVHNRIK